MRILLVYGTTEGHARYLLKSKADTLRREGQEVTLYDIGGNEPAPDQRATTPPSSPPRSMRAGNQAALAAFARTYREALNTIPSAFLSVSLAAAGENPDDWEELEQCVARFLNETAWKGGWNFEVVPVAGSVLAHWTHGASVEMIWPNMRSIRAFAEHRTN